MTCAVVNDASCLIDLNKGSLLAATCDLPYRLVVPLPVREYEILDFTEQDWRLLDEAGLVTHDLAPDEVRDALALAERHAALTANDCFCLVTAATHSGILLTGDAHLRKVGVRHGLRVHGVLWIIDELDANNTCSKSLLIQALATWLPDRTVFLPEREITHRLADLTERTRGQRRG